MVQILAVLFLLCASLSAQILGTANGGTGVNSSSTTAHKVFGNLTGSTTAPTFTSDSTTISTTAPLGGGTTFHLGDTITITCTTCSTTTGTVTSVATTSPITGGTITATGTIACATCVTSTSPGVGLAHFAGSTQDVTSSAVNLAGADVTGILGASNLPNAVTGFLLPPFYPMGAIGALSPTAVQNEMDCLRFVSPFTMTATKFSYNPTVSAGSSTHVGFAIYDTTGNSTRLMTTGALDGTLNTKQTVTVSSFTLNYATAYLYCWTNDAATPGTWKAYTMAQTEATYANLYNTTATTNVVKGATASTAGAPPATLSTLTAVASAVAQPPLAYIEP